MSRLRITVVEEATSADRYNWWGGALRLSEIRATSVKDMVDKILARLGGDDSIRKLTIVGHGSAGNISMGDGKGHERGKHIGIRNQAEWNDELNRLKGRFCYNARVTLRGCHTGAEQAGADLVALLADMLGVRVRAPKGSVNPLWVGNKWTEAPKV